MCLCGDAECPWCGPRQGTYDPDAKYERAAFQLQYQLLLARQRRKPTAAIEAALRRMKKYF